MMFEEIEVRLNQTPAGGRAMDLQELEALYTSGCARVLELEADAMRSKRQLKMLRDELRHVRAAIEFLQQAQAADDVG